MDRVSEAEALTLLETALDHGIQHFDTAPLYGWGASEARLGALAARRRADMVLVTKVGLDPPNLVQRVAGKFLRGAAPDLVNAQRGLFSPAHVRASVERSLAALRTDRIDALLLHEVRAGEISAPLLETLAALKREGKVIRVGLATQPNETTAILNAHRGIFEVIQVSLAGLAAVESADLGANALRVVHSVLAARLTGLCEKLARDQDAAGKFTQTFGVAAQDRAGIAELLLRDAISRNPAGVALFSSTTPAHIKAAARVASEVKAVESSPAPLLGALLADA
ncbi:MAG: aldo/keto reductase [Hyphomonadaceae bacterium]|nr:aldo/keto reductase [Hyphomonadaceae bacterium]